MKNREDEMRLRDAVRAAEIAFSNACDRVNDCMLALREAEDARILANDAMSSLREKLFNMEARDAR